MAVAVVPAEVERASVSDEVGLDRLTLAAVAQRLGVRARRSKHRAGLDEFQRDVAVLALEEPPPR